MDKRIVINLSASIIAFVVSYGINFILTPYITDSVGGTAAYGFVSLANNFISYISIITLALTSMSGRYITINIHENDYKKANIYFNSVLIACCVLSIVIICTTSFVIINLDTILNIPSEIKVDVKILFALLIFNFIIGLIGTAFSIATFSTNRLDLSSLRGIEANLIKALTLISLFSFLNPSIIYIGIATILTTMYINVSNVYYTKKLLPFVSINKKYFSFKAIKEIIKSGLWNVFTRISSILSTGLDLLIANLCLGSSYMGILSISKTIPTMILSLFSMLSNVFAPKIVEYYAKKNIEKLEIELFRAMKLLGMISCIPVTILIVYGDKFYHLWIPNENSNLLHLLSLIICMEFVFVLPLEPIWNIFTITDKLKIPAIYMFINSILSISGVFILLSIVENELLKLLIIAGFSTIFNIIRALLFLPIYGAKCIGFKWYIFYKQIFKSIISVFIMTCLTSYIRPYIEVNSWIQLILISLIISMISLIINYFLILDPQDRLYMKKISKSIRFHFVKKILKETN